MSFQDEVVRIRSRVERPDDRETLGPRPPERHELREAGDGLGEAVLDIRIPGSLPEARNLERAVADRHGHHERRPFISSDFGRRQQGHQAPQRRTPVERGMLHELPGPVDDDASWAAALQEADRALRIIGLDCARHADRSVRRRA